MGSPQLRFAASSVAVASTAARALADPSPAFLVANINTANDVMLVGSFADVNGTLFFTADDGTTGRELWAVPAAALADGDQDGLEDQDEVAQGTDPADADSDDDGLGDGAEVHTHGTNPLLADTDGDGHSDGEEVITLHTDPLDPNDPPGIPLAPAWALAAAMLLLGASARRRR
jgi:MYXO-CTERM domain-containing protein